MSDTRKIVLGGIAATCLAVLCGFGIWSVGGALSPQPAQVEVEVEDCDAEDWKNYDRECGRISPRPAASKASPAKTAPTTRRTR